MTTTMTLKQLNANTHLQTTLIMLRALNTSDLFTSTYTMLKQSTVADIVDVCRETLQISDIDELNDDEKLEYNDYLENMSFYANYKF